MRPHASTLALVLACSGAGATVEPDASVRLDAAIACPCDAPPTPPAFAVEPTIHQNPNPAVPLAAIVEFATASSTRGTTVEVLGDPAGVVSRTNDVRPAASTSVPVLGLVPDTAYTIRVTITDAEDGLETHADLSYRTPALPMDFPPIQVTSTPSRMEPGVTIFDAIHWAPTGPDNAYGLIVAVDEAGEVVWYYRGNHSITDVRRLADGNLLYVYGEDGAVEIDMLGNVVRQWYASALGATGPDGAVAVDTDSIHHEMGEGPPGRFVALGSERRTLPGYPSSETDPSAPPAAADVIGDVVVEFTPDGAIADRFALLDLLDPHRIGYGSLGGFWNAHYGGTPTKDWSHGNAVVYDATDDSLVVSARHQDALVKIARATGEIVWILGTPDGWGAPWADKLLAPVGDLEWPYHQHAPEIEADGHVLVFDNGNGRARPFSPPLAATDNHSRAVEFAIDAAARTVEQVWEYGPADEVFYSAFLGDADRQPTTGNVLITDGGRVRDAMGHASDAIFTGQKWARIIEVTHATPSEKVFELTIDDPAAAAPAGWSIYRADRLPSLYPPAP